MDRFSGRKELDSPLSKAITCSVRISLDLVVADRTASILAGRRPSYSYRCLRRLHVNRLAKVTREATRVDREVIGRETRSIEVIGEGTESIVLSCNESVNYRFNCVWVRLGIENFKPSVVVLQKFKRVTKCLKI